MKATKQEQDMLNEMVSDMVMDKRWDSLTGRPDFSKFIMQILVKGYSPMFKQQRSVVDEMQDDNLWISFVELEESKWYIKLKDYELTAADRKEFEKYYEFNGRPAELESQMKEFSPRYIYKKDGKSTRVDEDFLFDMVLNYTNFDERKAKAIDFINHLDVGSSLKTKYLNAVKATKDNKELQEYILNFKGSKEYEEAENRKVQHELYNSGTSTVTPTYDW